MLPCDTCFMNRLPSSVSSLGEGPPAGATVLLEVASLDQAIQALIQGSLAWDLGRDHSGHGQAQTWLQCEGTLSLAEPSAIASAKSISLRQGFILEPLPTAGWGSPTTPSLSQPWAPQPGGDCSWGLAPPLKKPWNKVSPSAVRAVLGFSLT